MLAGQRDWASERWALAVMREGGNISLSLLISCTGWDTQQLMAFAVISYQSLPLHSHLDLSRTPPAFFAVQAGRECSSSRNTHAILTHRSDDEAFLPRPPPPFVVPPFLPHQFSSASLNLWIMNPPTVNLHSSWKNADRRCKASGYRYLCELSFLSVSLVSDDL